MLRFLTLASFLFLLLLFFQSTNQQFLDIRLPSHHKIKQWLNVNATSKGQQNFNDYTTIRFDTIVDPEYKEIVNQSRAIIQQLRNESGVPGLVVGVSVNGKTVWTEAFGYSNLEDKIPCSINTIMRIGSITKSMTSALAAWLVEKGELDFDKPISEYLTESQYPTKFWEGHEANMTIKQLLAHRAGVRENSFEDFVNIVRFSNSTEASNFFRNDELIFEPDTDFTYSNPSYELAAAVIETRLSNGSSFENALDELLKNEFRLNNTMIDKVNRIISNRTQYYLMGPAPEFEIYETGLLKASIEDDLLIMMHGAAGGAISTVPELLQYGNLMLDAYGGKPNAVLKNSTVELMWTPLTDVEWLIGGYGIGWVDSNLLGKQVIWHGGNTFGASAYLGIYPEYNTVVTMLTNLRAVDYFNPAIAIGYLFTN